MVRFFLPVLVLVASCSWIPNSIVRVAIAPENTVARAQWSAVPGVEVVAPNAFPPADLIWFDGAFDSPEFQNQALGFNAGVEAQARASGLAPGWVTDSGDRILPVQWSPGPGGSKPAKRPPPNPSGP